MQPVSGNQPSTVSTANPQTIPLSAQNYIPVVVPPTNPQTFPAFAQHVAPVLLPPQEGFLRIPQPYHHPMDMTGAVGGGGVQSNMEVPGDFHIVHNQWVGNGAAVQHNGACPANGQHHHHVIQMAPPPRDGSHQGQPPRLHFGWEPAINRPELLQVLPHQNAELHPRLNEIRVVQGGSVFPMHAMQPSVPSTGHGSRLGIAPLFRGASQEEIGMCSGNYGCCCAAPLHPPMVSTVHGIQQRVDTREVQGLRQQDFDGNVVPGANRVVDGHAPSRIHHRFHGREVQVIRQQQYGHPFIHCDGQCQLGVPFSGDTPTTQPTPRDFYR